MQFLCTACFDWLLRVVNSLIVRRKTSRTPLHCGVITCNQNVNKIFVSFGRICGEVRYIASPVELKLTTNPNNISRYISLTLVSTLTTLTCQRWNLQIAFWYYYWWKRKLWRYLTDMLLCIFPSQVFDMIVSEAWPEDGYYDATILQWERYWMTQHPSYKRFKYCDVNE